MRAADQIQNQLYSRPTRLAGRNGTFTHGRSITLSCRTVLSTTLSCEFDVRAKVSIGLNLFQNKPAGTQVSLSDHLAWFPVGEDQTRPKESPGEINFCSETDNADVV